MLAKSDCAGRGPPLSLLLVVGDLLDGTARVMGLALFQARLRFETIGNSQGVGGASPLFGRHLREKFSR